MTSFPHNLVLDSEPRFGLTQFEFLNLYNFLINKPIFMKIVAKSSDLISLSYTVQVKVCNPIPLILLRTAKILLPEQSRIEGGVNVFLLLKSTFIYNWFRNFGL